MTRLACQTSFSFLSIPESQQVAFAQDAVELDAYPRGRISTSVKADKLDWESYVPVNYICPEAYALLAAAEASAAQSRRAIDLNKEPMALDTNICWPTLHEPERALRSKEVMAAPKKFYKAFWRSVSRKLLHQWAQSARPPARSGPEPTAVA